MSFVMEKYAREAIYQNKGQKQGERASCSHVFVVENYQLAAVQSSYICINKSRLNYVLTKEGLFNVSTLKKNATQYKLKKYFLLFGIALWYIKNLFISTLLFIFCTFVQWNCFCRHPSLSLQLFQAT